MAETLYDTPLFRVFGDQGVLMEFGEGISPQIHMALNSMIRALEDAPIDGVVECMQAYRSIAVQYDSTQISYAELQVALMQRYEKIQTGESLPQTIIELPVCYGGKYGPDLDFVASEHTLSSEEVIRIHSEPDYLIYMIGFTPGFPYLGGLPEILHTPRLKVPRKTVPAGAVGIANGQTGMYPIESPGGWQLIGQVPIKVFDPEAENPFLFSAGNILKFKPVTEEEYIGYELC